MRSKFVDSMPDPADRLESEGAELSEKAEVLVASFQTPWIETIHQFIIYMSSDKNYPSPTSSHIILVRRPPPSISSSNESPVVNMSLPSCAMSPRGRGARSKILQIVFMMV